MKEKTMMHPKQKHQNATQPKVPGVSGASRGPCVERRAVEAARDWMRDKLFEGTAGDGRDLDKRCCDFAHGWQHGHDTSRLNAINARPASTNPAGAPWLAVVVWIGVTVFAMWVIDWVIAAVF